MVFFVLGKIPWLAEQIFFFKSHHKFFLDSEILVYASIRPYAHLFKHQMLFKLASPSGCKWIILRVVFPCRKKVFISIEIKRHLLEAFVAKTILKKAYYQMGDSVQKSFGLLNSLAYIHALSKYCLSIILDLITHLTYMHVLTLSGISSYSFCSFQLFNSLRLASNFSFS